MIPRSRYSRAWAVSLRYRDFRIFWASTLIYSLGTGMERLAIGWLVFHITGSAFMLGVAAAAGMAPLFFLGILSGAVADWLDRRSVLFYGAMAGAGIAAIMAILLFTGDPGVWVLILLFAAGGCVLSFTLTTRLAYTYDIVGQDLALNGLSVNQMGMQAGAILGAIAAGGLLQSLGPGWLFMAVGASFVASALLLLLIGPSQRSAPTEKEPVIQSLIGYIRFLEQNRMLLVLIALSSITEVLGFSHSTLLPVFAKDVLDLGPAGLGYLTAVRQAGGLLGLALMANLKDYRRKGLLMFVIAGLFGAGLMGFSVSSSLVYFTVLLAAVNACALAVDALYKTLMQTNVPDEGRGRAMGSWVFSIGVSPVGHLGVGGLAAALGAPGALLVNGAVLTGVSLAAAFRMPGTRRLE